MISFPVISRRFTAKSLLLKALVSGMHLRVVLGPFLADLKKNGLHVLCSKGVSIRKFVSPPPLGYECFLGGGEREFISLKYIFFSNLVFLF